MTVYLDTSVVLSWLLNQEPSIEEWGSWQAAYTSEIGRVEFHRTIDRLRLGGDLDDHERVFVHERFTTFWRSVYRVRVSGALLTRASQASQSYPTVVGTLDAIHLTSALAAHERRNRQIDEFLTHDGQLGAAARAVGFAVRGVADRDESAAATS